MRFIFRYSSSIIAATALSLGCVVSTFAQDAEESAAATAPAPEVSAQTLSDAAAASGSSLTLTDGAGNSIHILPSVERAAGQPRDVGPLVYHAGGPIMPKLEIYNIFWAPATLQSGGSTSIPAAYSKLMNNLAQDYVGHNITTLASQYYQTVGGVTTYISGLPAVVGNTGSRAASYTDTNPYPTSGCTDTITPGNCITEAQIETELARVMTLKGWTGGLNKIYLVFTGSGEGSCFLANSTAANCAYSGYCAYHGFTTVNSETTIFANIPYGSTTHCQTGGTPAPNGGIADAAATSTSHEITEAITDPTLSSWFTAAGSEIGDLCAYVYGPFNFDGGLANFEWNGHFYVLQSEYDNHAAGCEVYGP